MALVDPRVEGLIRGTGRTDVTKIAQVVDETIEAARVPRGFGGRTGGCFKEGGEQVFWHKTHHGTPVHCEISCWRSTRFQSRPETMPQFPASLGRRQRGAAIFCKAASASPKVMNWISSPFAPIMNLPPRARPG